MNIVPAQVHENRVYDCMSKLAAHRPVLLKIWVNVFKHASQELHDREG
jgi:hypothetical protein